MKSIFVKISYVLILLSVCSHVSANPKPCKNQCTGSPFIAQNATTCDCYCTSRPVCNSAQWWDASACLCRCYLVPSEPSSKSKESKSSEEITPGFKCSLPLTYSNSTCGCECLTQTCPGSQIPLKPSCACGCPDSDAEARCLSQSTFYSWDNVNCNCVSYLIDAIEEGFNLITYVATNPDQAFVEINNLTKTIGFDLDDLPGTILAISLTPLGELISKFKSILTPSGQILIDEFVVPIISIGVQLLLNFTAGVSETLNLFLTEFVNNVLTSNIIDLISGVVPSALTLLLG